MSENTESVNISFGIQKIINALEGLIDEYPDQFDVYGSIVNKLKRIHADKETISHLKQELKVLRSDYKTSLDALALSRQQVYELEDKLNASAT